MRFDTMTHDASTCHKTNVVCSNNQNQRLGMTHALARLWHTHNGHMMGEGENQT